jgi:glucose/arabinose dehydrogenase
MGCTPRDVPALATEQVAPGFGWHKPLFVTQAPDAPELYVLEQGDDQNPARILVVESGNPPSTFLDLTSLVNEGFESGLLGLAFHPDYNTPSDPNNGRFFVFYTTVDPRKNVVAEYVRSAGDPLAANPNEVQRLVNLDDRQQNHNGGMVTFGPDGFLYVAIGDEGGSGDPYLNGQNLSTIFGTILRLDVDASGAGFAAAGNPFSASTDPAGDPRIWHYGLRNPWRFSFDRDTREMYIGDVGQGDWEEIDVALADESGLNFGWSAYEGNEPFAGGSGVEDLPTPATFPIDVIPRESDPHLGNARSVTGGYVYRGDAISGLDGFYLFGDFQRGRVAAFEYRDGQTCNRQEIQELAGNGLSSFGQDNDGELYLTFLNSGEVLRIVEAP